MRSNGKNTFAISRYVIKLTSCERQTKQRGDFTAWARKGHRVYRVVQRGNSAPPAPEAVGEALIRNLDCDRAVEPRIPRLPDFAHAARAGARNYFIGAHARTRGQHNPPILSHPLKVLRPLRAVPA